MGVHGLWKLIEASGKPVPLESLENRVLAIDVSIWLHKAIKGFQDTKGVQIPNAHLLSIYHRICKLLYFKVKPVFVFDGGVPVLKKETIAKRNQQKSRNRNEADRIHKNLLNNLLKHTAISKVLSEKTKATLTAATTTKSNDKVDSLYFLPPQPSLLPPSSSSSSDEESLIEESLTSTPTNQWDLHSIDTNSAEFKSLPIEVRHDILTDLKETRKQSSWGRIHELPTESDDFSIYQMNRLLKRQNVQNALEKIEKEMGGHQLSLGELEKLLKDEGILESGGNRIASDENTRFVLIKNLKQAIDDAKKKDLDDIIEEQIEEDGKDEDASNRADVEFQNDLQQAIELSLQDQPSTSGQSGENYSKQSQRMECSPLNFDEDSDDFITESSEDDGVEFITKLKSAQNYMIEYSGLTPSEIAKIIGTKTGKSKKIDNPQDTKKAEKRPEKQVIGHVEENKNTTKENHAEDQHGENCEELGKQVEENHDNEVNNGILGEKIENRENLDEEDNTNIDEEHEVDNSGNLATEKLPVEDPTSDSSDDEFVDVEDAITTSKTESPNSNQIGMEVVIKPDETIEDDLFSDIFTNENPETTETKTVEDEKSVESGERFKEPEPKTGTLKNKLEKWIQQYTKPTKTDEDSSLSVQQLQEIRDNLQKEQNEMIIEKSSKERLATNLTDQIYQETQELLELFGVPYIVAPMEAEAQCAFLEQINLVDGTITDDSDIWLFGGKTVYKNFFNNDKSVLEFRAENIQHHFKLTRYQMVLLALLVGSDYTIGLPGIGPVTALEILAAFPPKPTTEFTLTQFELISGLKEFRQWCEKGKSPAPGRTGLRNKLKNLEIHRGFPSVNVIQAYLEPNVETSDEKFTWSKPDIVGLCDFAKRKFGWTLHKSQEILKPIIKRMNDTKKQKKLLDYYQMMKSKPETVNLIESKLSKRVQMALNRLDRNPEETRKEAEELEEDPKTKQKHVRKKKVEKEAKELEEDPKNKRKHVRKKKVEKEAEELEEDPQTKQKCVRKKKVEKDEDVGELQKVERRSRKRMKQIENEMREKQEELEQKKVKLPNLNSKKEIIPQKQRDKTDMFKNKLKAIEVFRKSKQGPGYAKRTPKTRKPPKEDADLSESSTLVSQRETKS